MRLITVLNRCTEFKRFVFEGSHLDEHERIMVERIMVSVRSRKNSKAGVQPLRSVVNDL